MNILTPRGFLLFGGIILLVLAVAGMTVLGPTPTASALGMFNWLDGGENIAHLVLGVVAIAAYFLLKDQMLAKYLVLLVGVVALLATVFGFLNMGNPDPNTAGFTNLEVSDDVLHLVVAVWAFAAVLIGGAKSTPASA